MGMNESYIPVERDKVSSNSSAETPMDILNDAARKRQSGASAGKIQEAKGKGAVVDLAGLAYSLAKYSLTQYEQAKEESNRQAKKFLAEQKEYIEEETVTLTNDEILESHKHLRHFEELPTQANTLTSLLVSQFGLAQFIANTIIRAYQKDILEVDDFFSAAEFFTGLSYLKNLDPVAQQDVSFDQKIYEKFMNKDASFISDFRQQDLFIRLMYELKVSASEPFKDIIFREVPFATIKKKFEEAYAQTIKQKPEFKKFVP